jgi:hypothetical protein
MGAVSELRAHLRAALGDLAHYERIISMADITDANLLADPGRVRRTELHARHDVALRALAAAEGRDVPDKKDVADAQAAVKAAVAAIQDEYREDPVEGPK